MDSQWYRRRNNANRSTGLLSDWIVWGAGVKLDMDISRPRFALQIKDAPYSGDEVSNSEPEFGMPRSKRESGK